MTFHILGDSFIDERGRFAEQNGRLHFQATFFDQLFGFFGIPVSFDFTLEVQESSYTYTWNHFEVNNPDNGIQFEFEKKPDSIKQITYDQLLQKTHKRIAYVTGYLKRYMNGEE